WLGLFLYDGDVVVTGPLQYIRNGGDRGAVKGGEYDLKIVFSLDMEIPVFQRGLNKSLINLPIDQFDQGFIGPELDILKGKSIDRRNDSLILGRHYLTAIAPINFVPVVFWRIMGGG